MLSPHDIAPYDRDRWAVVQPLTERFTPVEKRLRRKLFTAMAVFLVPLVSATAWAVYTQQDFRLW